MRLMTLVIASSLAVATAACAKNRTDLTKTGAIGVEIDGGPRSAVRYGDVYYDDYDDKDVETVIQGTLYNTGVPFYPLHGEHVHITVVSPDGQVIAEKQPRLIWQTRSRQRAGIGRFTIRLPQAVPSGTVVKVVYHERFHSNVNAAGRFAVPKATTAAEQSAGRLIHTSSIVTETTAWDTDIHMTTAPA